MKHRAQPWLGTLVEITIDDALGEAELLACFNDAFAAIAEVHRLMSFHDPASDVSRINRAAIGESVEIHAHTDEVIRCALSMASASDGLFNISCAPMLVEWAYLPIPAGDTAVYLPCRPTLVREYGHRIRKLSAAWIDLGGIAKGYAVDLAIAALRRSGIQSACVNAGGDLRVFGDVRYPIVIRNPERPTVPGLQIALRGEALASSGIYFSRKRVDGREYSALINGKNGQAITAGLSVSVRAPCCMLADALTKVVMASADPAHPALSQFGATAFII